MVIKKTLADLLLRMLGRFCIGAIAALCCVTAYAQNPSPAQWYGNFNLRAAALPLVRLWGYGNCGELGNAMAALIEADAATLQPPVTINWVNRPACGNTSTLVIWGFRYSDDFPTTGTHGINMNAYCGGAAASSNPNIGVFCSFGFVRYLKNIGICWDCLVGNPIAVGFGNKLQRETDYVGMGAFPLRFERIYNSAQGIVSTMRPGLGVNWWHPNFRSLFFSTANSGSITLAGANRPDGKMISFQLVGSAYVADTDYSAMRLEQLQSGWKITTAEDEVELYDSGGRLLSITNRVGLAHTFSYFVTGPGAGLLQSVSDPFGRTLTFQYNSKGQISSMTDPAGGSYIYSYSADGQGAWNLATVTFPDGKQRSYQYENLVPNLLTGITDELGVRYATFAYEGGVFHRATLTKHADGIVNADVFSVTYPGGASADGATVTQFITGSVTATRTYHYQTVLNVERQSGVTGPACPSCGPAAQTFDANGNVASRTDWNGNRTNYTYDLARNLETSRTEGLTSGGASTAQTRKTSTEWHPSFRLVSRMAEPLRLTTYIYNGDGGASCGFMSDGTTLVPGVLCSKTVQATTDVSGALGFGAALTGTPRTWTYTYNANGQVLTMDGPRTDVADVTTYTYYANNDADLGKRGNVASITNAAGQTTQITAYNSHSQPLAIVDPNGLTTTLTYDLRQRLTSRSVGGETTTYTYDPAGQLTQVTLPDNSFLSYTYDAAHRLTAIQDNLSNRIAYTLDLAGNRVQEQVFDPANALAQTRSRVISNINRVFQELGAAGQTTEYGYDNQGNVTSVKDPLNHITANQYDPLNRLKQVTDPGTGVTLYGYNGLDALTQVTDPRNLATTYSLDGLSNLNQQNSPDTGTTANTYDAAGNLLTQTDAKSQVTTYAYDALNRVTLITFQDGSKQTYAYDQGANGLGRLSSITETNPASQVTSVLAYAYDQKGRVTSETRTVNGVAYVLAYAYDSSGRLTGMTYPSGRTVTYALDALGRVNQVTTTKDSQSQVVLQNVAYHPFGGAKSWTLGNGQIYSRTVDQDGRIAAYTLGAANNTITFDAASRITGIAANTYGYDTLDRLTSAVLPSSNFAYGYDAVGNRLSKTTGANTDTYAYGATSNRIATLTPASGSPRSFVLDANGSTTNDALNTYAYDTRGRMVQASNGAGTTSYQVNALGQRIRKTGTGVDTVFTYDTWGKLIAESDPGGVMKREYLYLGDIPVAVLQ